MVELKQRFSAFRLVCLLALAVLTVGLTSCHVVSSEEESEAAETSEVIITADSIAKLAPGEKLIVDRAHDKAYTFDFAAAPIDFSRIEMLMEDGHKVAMDRWLNSSEYGAKLLASPNKTFRLAAKKQSLERLPSLKERNTQLIRQIKQQNAIVCDVYVTVIVYEILICTDEGCYYEYGEIVEVTIECYDDGTEP